MKVSQLRELLEKIQQVHKTSDDDVVIEVKRSTAAVGPTHRVAVTGVSPGFDWNHGVVFLMTEEPVWAGMNDMADACRFANRIFDILHMAKDDKSRNRYGNAVRLMWNAMDRWLKVPITLVQCDKTNNSESDIENGRMNIDVITTLGKPGLKTIEATLLEATCVIYSIRACG